MIENKRRGRAQNGATGLRSALLTISPPSDVARRGIVVILSPTYLTTSIRHAFAGLKHCFAIGKPRAVIVIQVLDPAEIHPERSALRGDVSLVDCEGGDPRDVTLSPATLEAYAAAHEQFCGALASSCRARGIPYFRAEIDQPFDELVLRMFRLGGLLR